MSMFTEWTVLASPIDDRQVEVLTDMLEVPEMDCVAGDGDLMASFATYSYHAQEDIINRLCRFYIDNPKVEFTVYCKTECDDAPTKYTLCANLLKTYKPVITYEFDDEELVGY